MTFYSNVKQKSYVLNPRGKPLYEDENRFGTKMLEKMGWSKGKGLGAKENGEQNFIRVAHKIDQKGIGFKDRDDQWTGHENNFNSFLKSLDNSANVSENESVNEGETRNGFGFGFNEKKTKKSKSIKEKISGKSLEEMSKNSSVRVHYRKFTRGKDISKYSEKDLANIFGKKCTNGDDTVEPEKSVSVEEQPENTYGITTIDTNTTIQDYFKMKKNKRNVECTESEPVPTKKRRKKDNESKFDAVEADEIKTINVEENTPPKKEKKKKKSKRETAIVETIAMSDEDSDCEIVSVEMKKKKKKKKNKKNSDDSQPEANVLENSTATEDNSNVSVEKVPKKKKRDKKNVQDCSMSNNEVTTNEKVTISNTEFMEGILSLLTVNSNQFGHSSTAVNPTNDDEQTISANRRSQYIAMDEVFEINRYHAEMFRFVDLDGFPNANLSDLNGYGFNKEFELKISEKSKDQGKINDLWDYALINKYGKEALQAKKAKRYSIKQLKKKNLFTTI